MRDIVERREERKAPRSKTRAWGTHNFKIRARGTRRSKYCPAEPPYLGTPEFESCSLGRSRFCCMVPNRNPANAPASAPSPACKPRSKPDAYGCTPAPMRRPKKHPTRDTVAVQHRTNRFVGSFCSKMYPIPYPTLAAHTTERTVHHVSAGVSCPFTPSRRPATPIPTVHRTRFIAPTSLLRRPRVPLEVSVVSSFGSSKDRRRLAGHLDWRQSPSRPCEIPIR